MPRNPELIAKRNAKIRTAYNRLIAEEVPTTFQGRRVYMKLNYSQVITMLGQMFDLSPRTVEPIITATNPEPVSIKTAASA